MSSWALTKMFPTPKLHVCFSEDEQREAMEEEGIDRTPTTFGGEFGKTTHYEEPNGENVVLVCFPELYEDSVETMALFAHEAVHVAQAWCDMLQENNPGREVMAYMVQAAATAIIDAHEKRLQANAADAKEQKLWLDETKPLKIDTQSLPSRATVMKILDASGVGEC